MKNKWILITLILIIALVSLVQSALAESEIEAFLKDFKPKYDFKLGYYMIDSENPWAQSVRLMKTTSNGMTVMVDKVLVTEDEFAVSFLISGDISREKLGDVQLQSPIIDLQPLLEYPPDSFDIVMRGGGGGDANLRILNEDPLVILDTHYRRLLRSNGYIAAANPIEVKMTLPQINIGWTDFDEHGNTLGWDYFYDDDPLEFEFVADGSALAEKTKTFDLNHSFELRGTTYEFHRFRFNPMDMILFTGPLGDLTSRLGSVIRMVEVKTDDGTTLRVQPEWGPYYGFRKKVMEPEVFEALDKAEKLMLTPCYLPKPEDEYPDDFPFWDEKEYECNPDFAVTVVLKD